MKQRVALVTGGGRGIGREAALLLSAAGARVMVVSRSAAELAVFYVEHPPRGEIVLVVGAAAAGSADREQALTALRALVDAGARGRPAASVVSKLTGIGANELYRALTDSS